MLLRIRTHATPGASDCSRNKNKNFFTLLASLVDLLVGLRPHVGHLAAHAHYPLFGEVSSGRCHSNSDVKVSVSMSGETGGAGGGEILEVSRYGYAGADT